MGTLIDRLRSRRLAWAGVGFLASCVACAVVALAGYFWLLPRYARSVMIERLEGMGAGGAIESSVGAVSARGLDAVEVREVRLAEPGGEVFLTIERALVALDRSELLLGRKAIRRLELDGATLYLRQDERGSWNIQRIRRSLARPNESSTDPGEAKERAGLLERYFGGGLPEIQIERAAIRVRSELGRPALSALELPKLSLDDGRLAAAIEVPPESSGPGTTLPRSIAVGGTLGAPLDQSSIEVELDEPVRIEGPPGAEAWALGFADLDLAPGPVVTLKGLYAEPRSAAEGARLSVDVVEASFEALPSSLASARPTKIALHRPRLVARRSGGATLRSLARLSDSLRSSEAAHVAGSARRLASTIAPGSAAGAGGVAKLERLLGLLPRLLPEAVEIKGGSIALGGAPPAGGEEAVANGIDALFEHDRASGQIRAKLSFAAELEASAPDPSAGVVDLDLTANYRTKALRGTASVKALRLAWASRFTGYGQDAGVRGGTLSATFRASQDEPGQPIRFEGDAGADRLSFYSERLAPEPIEAWSFGYKFAGYFDPDARIPPPTIAEPAPEPDLSVASENDDALAASDEPAPERGALVVERGTLRSNDLRVEWRPALYGLDGLSRRPRRLDFALKLEPVPLQRVLDAIPDAILGPLARAEIAGTASADMKVEIPLYDASRMAWSDEPKVSAPAILSLPEEVDVRKLTRAFRTTIRDPKVLYEREIRVPAMSVTPADWLTDNAGLTSAQVDAHWRGGHIDGGGPGYWGSTAARMRAPSRPWSARDDPRIKRKWSPPSRDLSRPMRSDPYGPYVYVPLHHISPWIPRAILTTEDNSFFKHDGFNRTALRASIERNLDRGAFVRGASTISMQLAKNLFLNREKVIARKVQEALLVWLMESVVRVPKARLLEIYLNVIEFAPGVFGIHDAAVHYFGKRPDELTLAECAWLVTIVPGPKKYHAHWMRGEMSDRYFERVKRYMRSMKSRERVTEQEYEEAAALKPPFYKPPDGAPALKPIESEKKSAIDFLLPGLFRDDPSTPKPAPVGTKNAPQKPAEKKTLWPF